MFDHPTVHSLYARHSVDNRLANPCPCCRTVFATTPPYIPFMLDTRLTIVWPIRAHAVELCLRCGGRMRNLLAMLLPNIDETVCFLGLHVWGHLMAFLIALASIFFLDRLTSSRRLAGGMLWNFFSWAVRVLCDFLRFFGWVCPFPLLFPLSFLFYCCEVLCLSRHVALSNNRKGKRGGLILRATKLCRSPANSFCLKNSFCDRSDWVFAGSFANALVNV